MEIQINKKFKQNDLIYKSYLAIFVFLFGLYHLIEEKLIWLLVATIITLPTTLLSATTQCCCKYFQSVSLNFFIIVVICFYPVLTTGQTVPLIFALYLLLDYLLLKRKINKILNNHKIISSLNSPILNRDQFSLDFEISHGRVWQRKYHQALLTIIIFITPPTIFFLREINFYHYFSASAGAFFTFIIWEYALKRVLFFTYLFNFLERKKAH